MSLPSTPVLKRSPFYRNRLIRDAIGQAIYDAMADDPSIHLFGEGAEVKMHYDAPQIEQDFGHRVHTHPIAEDGIVNFAVGAALVGVKPIVDVITADFLFRAMDSIVNTAAKLNFVAPEGEPLRTIIIRAEFLTSGPTTGQRPEAIFTHIPGLNVLVPSTPQDAYGLMRTALISPEVTIFFEDRMIEDDGLSPEDLLKSWQPRPLGTAALRRRPAAPAVTVVTYGLMRQRVERALEQAGVDDVLVLDLRSLFPLDWKAIRDGAQETGRLLIVEPDVTYGGIGAEIAAGAAELGVTVRRLGAPRETIPASPHLQEGFLPGNEQILAALRAIRL